MQVGLLTMLSLTLRAAPVAAVVASQQLLQAGKRFTSPARLPLLLWALNQAARWGPCHVQQDVLLCPWMPALHLQSSCRDTSHISTACSSACWRCSCRGAPLAGALLCRLVILPLLAMQDLTTCSELHCWQVSGVPLLSSQQLTTLYARLHDIFRCLCRTSPVSAIGAWVRVVLPQVVGSTLPEGPSSPAKPAPAVQQVAAMAPPGISLALTYLSDLLSGTAAQAAQQVPTGLHLWPHPQTMDLARTHDPAACIAQGRLSGAALHTAASHMAGFSHLSVTLHTAGA